MSGHHLLALTSMRSQYIKDKCKIKLYRNYKKFDIDSFNTELSVKLNAIKDVTNSKFRHVFPKALKIYAPVREKILKFNNNNTSV